MNWYEKADLKALFGEDVDAKLFAQQSKDVCSTQLAAPPPTPGTLMAPPHPIVNPPGPTPLAPRPILLGRSKISTE